MAITDIKASSNINTSLNPAIKARLDKIDNPKILNLGNDKLNINTTTAKGLEKVIGLISSFIISAQVKTTGILYGKFKVDDSSSNAIQKALDKGIVNVLEDVAGIDFCNIVNYAINKIPGTNSFDPKKRAGDFTNPLERSKFIIQKAAFDIQTYIDDYYRSYGDARNPESKLGLSKLINSITEVLNTDIGFTNTELLSAFPELSTFGNFLQNSLGVFNRYTDVRQIPNTELQKIISYIDKTRGICIAIQGLNTPGAAINLIDSFTGGAVQDEIAKITKIINPARLIPLLKSILKTANNINSIGVKVLQYINSARTIIKIAVGLIKIFNVLKAFFTALAVPNQITTVGITTKFSDTYATVLKEQGEKRLIKRLNQINAVLNLTAIFVTSLIGGMANIIGKLNLILLNLENCNNLDPSLAEEVKVTVNNLIKTSNGLQKFLDTYNNNAKKLESNFGNYTIKIVTEEVTDQGISLKRRYGVALDSNSNKVLESTPTFASLDQIIINEVKVLLVSQGLVASDLKSMSAEDIQTITDSLNYLEDGEVDIQNLGVSTISSPIDDPDNENVDAGLGLNAFVNNLPGGKAMRKRMRKILGEQAGQLKSDLNSVDPNQKLTNSVNPVK
jgi:uncharacterized FlaG/YvyC family protein